MAYAEVPTRVDEVDANTAIDINQLQANFDVFITGTPTSGQFVMEGSTGNFGLGATPVDEFDMSRSFDGEDLTSKVFNTSNTASSNALQRIVVAGSSAGNPTTQYTVGGATSYSVGIDNSDSDKFKISGTAGIGSADLIEVTSAGAIRFNGYGAGTLTTDASGNITAV